MPASSVPLGHPLQHPTATFLVRTPVPQTPTRAPTPLRWHPPHNPPPVSTDWGQGPVHDTDPASQPRASHYTYRRFSGGPAPTQQGGHPLPRPGQEQSAHKRDHEVARRLVLEHTVAWHLTRVCPFVWRLGSTPPDTRVTRRSQYRQHCRECTEVITGTGSIFVVPSPSGAVRGGSTDHIGRRHRGPTSADRLDRPHGVESQQADVVP